LLPARQIESLVKENIGKQGALAYNKFVLIFIKDIPTCDVAGQQIGSELNPPELQPKHVGEGIGNECFSQPWEILNQDMPTAT